MRVILHWLRNENRGFELQKRIKTVSKGGFTIDRHGKYTPDPKKERERKVKHVAIKKACGYQ